MTKIANKLVQIHKNISHVLIQCHNNLLTTPATAGRQRISRQVLQKCNEGLVEEHRCWGWSGVHLLVSIDPENCKYCIFAVIKKELWSCLVSRIILARASATNTHKRESVESCYFVFYSPKIEIKIVVELPTAFCYLNIWSLYTCRWELVCMSPMWRAKFGTANTLDRKLWRCS